MKLPLAVGIGGTLLAVATAVLLWPETPPAVHVPPAATAPPGPALPPPGAAAAVAPRPAPPAAAARPEGLTLQGVLARPGANSEALLGTQGAAPQLYRAGDAVAGGWVLRNVAPDHVVLAKDGAEARLDLNAPTAQAAAPVLKGTSAEAPPGLAAGLPPLRTAEGRPESNRRFLQDRAERLKQTP